MAKRTPKLVRVKMLSIIAGPEYSGKPGDVLTVDVKTAKAWEAGKYAVILADPVAPPAPPKRETAMTGAGETAMAPAGEARTEPETPDPDPAETEETDPDPAETDAPE